VTTRAMLEAVKSDPNANKLAYRIHYETQTAYIKAPRRRSTGRLLQGTSSQPTANTPRRASPPWSRAT